MRRGFPWFLVAGFVVSLIPNPVRANEPAPPEVEARPNENAPEVDVRTNPAPPEVDARASPAPPEVDARTNEPASSASPDVDIERVERLEAWLAHQRDEMRFARRVVGPLSLAAGVLMLAPGIYGFADGIWDEQPNLGWLAFGVAGLGFAQGAVWLAIQSDPEERFARWRAARAAGLSADEVARFEGELRGTPSLARMERALIRWSGIGFVFGGGLYAGILAVDDPPKRHRVLGFTTSAIYGAVGIALLVYASLPELGETSWRHYEAGELPETPPRVQAHLAPSGGCDRWGCFAGLSVDGTFTGH